MSVQKCLLLLFATGLALLSRAQLRWQNVDSLFGPLPSSVQVFRTTDSLGGAPCIAYYCKAKLNDRSLDFTTQTGQGKRFTPSQYYEQEQQPLLVVNGTFFSFQTNQNLNVVVKDGKAVAYNLPKVRRVSKKDTNDYFVFRSAIGITQNRKADIAWIKTDSASVKVRAAQQPVAPRTEPIVCCDLTVARVEKILRDEQRWYKKHFRPWKVTTAIGGGPVLVQDGAVKISNEEEMLFTGKAINDRHPRTAMGYTADGYLIVLAVQGRFPGIAEGATLTQLAQILTDLGCTEALNLDGGGSSCLLINGKPTITSSDKTGQRPVPGVFLIKRR